MAGAYAIRDRNHHPLGYCFLLSTVSADHEQNDLANT
jgi:hypothetical protein